jgi:hypothetical protein
MRCRRGLRVVAAVRKNVAEEELRGWWQGTASSIARASEQIPLLAIRNHHAVIFVSQHLRAKLLTKAPELVWPFEDVERIHEASIGLSLTTYSRKIQK